MAERKTCRSNRQGVKSEEGSSGRSGGDERPAVDERSSFYAAGTVTHVGCKFILPWSMKGIKNKKQISGMIDLIEFFRARILTGRTMAGEYRGTSP